MLRVVLLSFILLGVSVTSSYGMQDRDIPTIHGRFDIDAHEDEPYLKRRIAGFLRKLMGFPVAKNYDKDDLPVEDEEYSDDQWLEKQLEQSGWLARNTEKLLRFLMFVDK